MSRNKNGPLAVKTGFDGRCSVAGVLEKLDGLTRSDLRNRGDVAALVKRLVEGNQFAEAATVLDQTLKADPRCFATLIDVALAYQKRGMAQEALETFRHALRLLGAARLPDLSKHLPEDDEFVHHLAGRALLAEGYADAALDEFLVVLRLDRARGSTSRHQLYREIARLLKQLGRVTEAKEALSDCRRALAESKARSS